MERQTVDFGIDLGTTNSVMARAVAGGVEIVPNTLEGELTPSAVAVAGCGQILVGQDALDKPDLAPATKFKRQMGTTNAFRMADASEMSPEQLSTEVLKELKAGAQLRYDFRLEHVVVTVPAMFLQPQCEATHRAVELAGLQAVTLLQEPIAAATAYLDGAQQDGDYLVYDLGGGTFDVSVVRLRDREMSVLAHGGDNYLGGTDFDRKLSEWVLGQVARAHGPAPHLEQSPYRQMLTRACEQARIRLSSRESVPIDMSDFGLNLRQIPLTREQLEDLIEEFVARTIRLTRERLEGASLRTSDVRSVLLVGGPTRTPYLRRRLDEELGIPRSHDLNPMTVVARGAAIHASALLRPERNAKQMGRAATSAILELFYDPVCQEAEAIVSGRVIDPPGFVGEVRLSRIRGDWDSGWVPLRNGAFVSGVLLTEGGSTEFHVSLRDTKGTLWLATPSALAMRHGVAAARPVTPYKYGVALKNGELHEILDYNQPLPAHGKVDLFAAHSVAAGSSEELSVYFLEGMSPVAKENTQVGHLVIHGRYLTRTLREGEKIEVRMHVDETRHIKARVYVPVFDLDFAVDMTSIIHRPNAEDLSASLEELDTTLEEIREAVGEEDQSAILQAYRDKEQLEAEMERVVRGEVGEAERVAQKLAGVKAEVRKLSGKYAVEAAYNNALTKIDEAEELAEEFGDAIGVATAAGLRREAEKCLRLDDLKGMEAVRERASSLFWKHYIKTDTCWVGCVEYLRESRHAASDPLSYHDYVQRAEECLLRKDYEGVRSFAQSAMNYLPDGQSQKDRFFNAGLRA